MFEIYADPRMGVVTPEYIRAKALCDGYVKLHISSSWKRCWNPEWAEMLRTTGPGPFAEDDAPPPPSLTLTVMPDGSKRGYVEEDLVSLSDISFMYKDRADEIIVEGRFCTRFELGQYELTYRLLVRTGDAQAFGDNGDGNDGLEVGGAQKGYRAGGDFGLSTEPLVYCNCLCTILHRKI